MKKEIYTIDGRESIIHAQEEASIVLIQPVDGHDIEELDNLIAYLSAHSNQSFLHIAVPIKRWNAELTPWQAPPVFGKIPFGEGASDTLHYIESVLVPFVKDTYQLQSETSFILGGYSLAGLFALWVAYQPSLFVATASASPSAWYKDWLPYAAQHQPQVKLAYLSLGDTEDHTKTKMMQTIKQDILQQYDLFAHKGVISTLEWNRGNHFLENGERMAKGFLWVIEKLESFKKI